MIARSTVVLMCLLHLTQATVLVRKEPMCTNLVEDQECAIHYEVYNLESDPITNVRFNDDYGMKLSALADVKGSTSVKINSLPSGVSWFHAIVVSPHGFEHGDKLFQLVHQPVVVQYTLNGEERATISTSNGNTTTMPPFVFSAKVFSRQFGPKLMVWLHFGLIVGAPTFVACVIHLHVSRKYADVTTKAL